MNCSLEIDMNYNEESLKLHESKKGKLEIKSKVKLKNKDDLSLAYTPGVAEPCRKIFENEDLVFKYTIKSNSIAVVSDGSAVLGLGNIGAKASIPVMEGKCILFKEFAGLDAFPICLDTQDPDEIINIVKNIAPVFGGINLEDIKAPNCFYIEEKLKEILDIPVMHDDQHGTAIVVAAALINSLKLKQTSFSDIEIVISGAGAAATAIVKLLRSIEFEEKFGKIKDIVLVDSKGIISKDRDDLNESKKDILKITNKSNISGDMVIAIKDKDVFIGVSKGDIVNQNMIQSMKKDSIVFPMANPIPEIMPDKALEAGALIVGTGRSDFPNQINNVLAFPGIFKGALSVRAKQITTKMKVNAAIALANSVKDLSKENILPSPLDKSIVDEIAKSVQNSI